MKHTPGPWHWDVPEFEKGTKSYNALKNENELPRIVSSTGEEVCHFGNSTEYYPTEGTPPKDSDARLMSAAPELLEALEHMVHLWESYTGSRAGKSRAVIAKARGE